MANTFNHNGKVVITDGGNVGIGTTSPTRLLEISATNPQFSIKSTSATGFSELYFGDNTADNGWIGYAHNGDYMYFGTNNSERMRITAAGNVGIGTTSPTYKLEVVGGSVNTQIARFITADYPTHSVGLGVDAQSTYWGASIFQDDVKRFTVDSTGGILVGGNYQGSDAPANGAAIEGSVGIGTTSPSYKLDVFGGFNAVTSGVNITYDNGILYHGNYYQITSGNNYLLYARGGGALLLGSDDVERIRITSAGNVGIGTTSPVSHAPSRRTLVVADTVNGANVEIWGNNAGGKSILQSVGGDTYVGNLANGSGAGTTYITSGNGSTYTTFLANGNVGIGTTTPEGKLHVSGGQVVLKGGGATDQQIIYNFAREYVNGIYNSSGHFRLQDNSLGGTVYQWDGSSFCFPNGNVGIGTTSPSATLHVVGTHYHYANIGFGTNLVRVDQYGTDSNYRLDYKQIVSSGLVKHSYSIVNNGIGYNNNLVLDRGSVGIGTDSPASALHVADTGECVVTIQDLDGTNQFLTVGHNGGSSYFLSRDNTSNGNFSFYTFDGTTISTRMYIAPAGNVGIGTTSPASKLHISGSSTQLLVQGDNYSGIHQAYAWVTNTYFGARYDGTNEVYGATNRGAFKIVALHDADNDPQYLAFYGANAGTAGNAITWNTVGFAQDEDGNVGIGTTSPTRGITINKTNEFASLNIVKANTTNQIVYLGTGSSGPDDLGILQLSDAGVVKVQIYTGGNSYFNGGNVGIGTTSPGYKLDVVASANGTYPFIVRNAGNVEIGGIYSSNAGAGQIYLFNASTVTTVKISTIDSSYFNGGNVGIGTTNPGAKLDVSGTALFGNTSSGWYVAPSNVHIGGTGTAQLSFEDVGIATAAIALKSSAMYFGHQSTNVDYVFKYGNTYNGNYATSGTAFAVISNGGNTFFNGGNVGIGTTSPSARLHIGESGAPAQLWLQRTDGYNPVKLIGGTLADGNGFKITMNTTDAFAITSGGNVGIGTTSPDTPLSTARGIVINSGASNDVQIRMQNNATGSTGSDGGLLSISGSQMYLWNYEASNLIFGTNNSERMRIDSSGNIGIGTTSISYRVDISGDARILSGSLGVGVAPNATDGRIDASNDIVAYSTSDQRLKENVTPIENALEKVKTLTGVEFDWKEETAHVHGYHGHDVGIIAQDVQAVLPEAVRTNESGYLSVRYEKMIALLIEANKELAARVEILEQKLKQ